MVLLMILMFSMASFAVVFMVFPFHVDHDDRFMVYILNLFKILSSGFMKFLSGINSKAVYTAHITFKPYNSFQIHKDK